LPYLLLIVDEFGELLASRPDFIDLFVAVGRLGRSLGMHLLLSSQQLEEGRLRGLEGHLSYRIALRTFSAQESRSVLGVPDAYELPPVPGSGYLKVGTRVYTRFRAAIVSQPYAAPREEAQASPRLEPFTLQGLGAGELAAGEPRAAEEEAGGRSMLETAVAQLREAAPRVHQVWLPPLEPALTLDAVIGELRSRPGPGLLAPDPQWSGRLAVPLGLVDRPAEQARGVLSVDLSGAGGHLLLVGAPQTGRSTLLRTLICAFSLTHTPLEAQFYCVDYGGGALASLEALPQVGGVCGRHDPERVRRTVSEVTALLDERERRFGELGIDSPAAMRAQRGTGRTGAGSAGGERLGKTLVDVRHIEHQADRRDTVRLYAAMTHFGRLVGEHDMPAGDLELGVADLAARAGQAHHLGRTERLFVEIDRAGRVADDQVGRDDGVIGGNWLDHKEISSRFGRSFRRRPEFARLPGERRQGRWGALICPSDTARSLQLFGRIRFKLI